MASRYNPPPNWPPAPPGWTPPQGWQPDPAWGPPPYGWQLWVDDGNSERRNWFGRHRVLTVIGAFLLLVIVISVAASHGGKTPSAVPAASNNKAPAGSGAQPHADSPQVATVPSPATTVSHVVLTESGVGIKQTARFTTDADWDLTYSYNCSKFGSTGNFIVSDDTDMPLVNELNEKGSSVTHQHSSGSHYLSVNSECSWTIKVTNVS